MIKLCEHKFTSEKNVYLSFFVDGEISNIIGPKWFPLKDTCSFKLSMFIFESYKNPIFRKYFSSMFYFNPRIEVKIDIRKNRRILLDDISHSISKEIAKIYSAQDRVFREKLHEYGYEFYHIRYEQYSMISVLSDVLKRDIGIETENIFTYKFLDNTFNRANSIVLKI